MLVKLSVAAERLGVSIHTLHQWRKEGKIKAQKLGATGKYRYDIDEIEGSHECPPEKIGVIYARVSTKKQSKFLENQIDRLKAKYPDHEVFSDIASGLNFKRKGLRKVLDRCIAGGVREVCVAHKDRLCRFAFDLIEHILRKHGTRVIVDEHDPTTTPNAESELGEDIISIVTVFGAKLHGARGGRKRRVKQAEATAGATDPGEGK
jgi:putative resolvase